MKTYLKNLVYVLCKTVFKINIQIKEKQDESPSD